MALLRYFKLKKLNLPDPEGHLRVHVSSDCIKEAAVSCIEGKTSFAVLDPKKGSGELSTKNLEFEWHQSDCSTSK